MENLYDLIHFEDNDIHEQDYHELLSIPGFDSQQDSIDIPLIQPLPETDIIIPKTNIIVIDDDKPTNNLHVKKTISKKSIKPKVIDTPKLLDPSFYPSTAVSTGTVVDDNYTVFKDRYGEYVIISIDDDYNIKISPFMIPYFKYIMSPNGIYLMTHKGKQFIRFKMGYKNSSHFKSKHLLFLSTFRDIPFHNFQSRISIYRLAFFAFLDSQSRTEDINDMFFHKYSHIGNKFDIRIYNISSHKKYNSSKLSHDKEATYVSDIFTIVIKKTTQYITVNYSQMSEHSFDVFKNIYNECTMNTLNTYNILVPIYAIKKIIYQGLMFIIYELSKNCNIPFTHDTNFDVIPHDVKQYLKLSFCYNCVHFMDTPISVRYFPFVRKRSIYRPHIQQFNIVESRDEDFVEIYSCNINGKHFQCLSLKTLKNHINLYILTLLHSKTYYIPNLIYTQ